MPVVESPVLLPVTVQVPVLAEVTVPAKNPTCVVFGGAAMNELYVTSARQEMSDEELERAPEAGGVYLAVIEDARGLADSPFLDA